MSEPQKRKIAPWERMLNFSPFSIVSMVVRIKGNVSQQLLEQAIEKVQKRHYLLRVKIVLDEDKEPWFDTEEVQKIPIIVGTRVNDLTWIEIYDEACKVPFKFDKEPPIRFYLIKSEEITDIMIFCHHVICDGKSLAYLARDLMKHLGNPDLEPEILPYPEPITRQNIPADLKLSGLMVKIIDKIKTKLDQEKIKFDQKDYLNIHKAYWENYSHRTITIELSEGDTNKIVQNSKRYDVSVNSAIITAFSGAQIAVEGKKDYHSKIGIGVDLRTRLNPPLGECMGFYAGVANVDYSYNPKKDFWKNAQILHKKANDQYSDKNFFEDPLTFDAMDPNIMESRYYKTLGKFVTPDSSRYEKISYFSKREDTVLKLLKRSKSDSVENIMMGTAITNLTKMDFPDKYGDLELERLIMQPGGAFPLVTVPLVIGVVTCSGKMSILIEFAEEKLDTKKVQKIKELALSYLFS